MTNEDLGYKPLFEKHRTENQLTDFEVGRVVSEHKERYDLRSGTNYFDAELIGNLRFSAQNREDFPAVGDWVAFSEYDQGKALIHSIFPRYSILKRQAVGKSGQIQIIATNIDYALLVMAVDRDFNLNRLERYLTICNASKVEPVIVLSKIDLISSDELKVIVEQVNQRMLNIPVFIVSNVNKGYDELLQVIE